MVLDKLLLTRYLRARPWSRAWCPPTDSAVENWPSGEKNVYEIYLGGGSCVRGRILRRQLKLRKWHKLWELFSDRPTSVTNTPSQLPERGRRHVYD